MTTISEIGRVERLGLGAKDEAAAARSLVDFRHRLDMVAADADVIRSFGDVDAGVGEIDFVVADLHVAAAEDHLRAFGGVDDVIVRDQAAVDLRELDHLVAAGVHEVVIDLPVPGLGGESLGGRVSKDLPCMQPAACWAS